MVQGRKPGGVEAGQPDEAEDLPLPPSVVVLKAAVYLMGVLLIAGFAFLVYVLVSRVSTPPIAQVDQASAAASLKLEPGEAIQSLALDRNLLAVHVKRPDGSSVIIIHDLNKGETVRRLQVEGKAAN